jgi:hypothetical protein
MFDPRGNLDPMFYSSTFRLTIKAGGVAFTGALLGWISIQMGWTLLGRFAAMLIVAGIVIAVIAPYLTKGMD